MIAFKNVNVLVDSTNNNIVRCNFICFVFSCQVALKCGKTYGSDKVKVMTLAKNRGKGGAIKMVGLLFMVNGSFDSWPCSGVCAPGVDSVVV